MIVFWRTKLSFALEKVCGANKDIGALVAKMNLKLCQTRIWKKHVSNYSTFITFARLLVPDKFNMMEEDGRCLQPDPLQQLVFKFHFSN